jgi:glycosyltransferase involved in cell wall biosynthesis
MKITILCPPPDLSGGQRVIAIYAERLSRRGHEVVVVSHSRRVSTLAQKIKSAARGRGWTRAASGQPSHWDRLDVERLVLDTYRPIRDADVPDADVVIATWWETAEWAAALTPSKGTKVCFVQGYEMFPQLPIDRIKATWRLSMQKIAVSQWLVDIAREQYGDDGAILVPNAVDASQFYAAPRGKNAAPTLGLMYAPVAFKGTDISIEAVKLASERSPGLHLVSFGTGPPTPNLPLPAGAEYIVQPAQDEIREIYSRCDAWLFGSRAEGFGLPILEAMACRTPVIATPAGAAPELLADGGGILVAPENPQDMARAILEVIAMDEDRWSEMSERAYATATRYTWDDATDRFEAALINVVEKHLRLQPR